MAKILPFVIPPGRCGKRKLLEPTLGTQDVLQQILEREKLSSSHTNPHIAPQEPAISEHRTKEKADTADAKDNETLP